MPIKVCGLGFDCAGMMLCPGIDPGDCLNYKACGAAAKMSPEEELELQIARERGRDEYNQAVERWYENFRITRGDAAIMMLMERGCPQTVESMGLIDLLNEVQTLSQSLQTTFESLEGEYIAPMECEVHRYNVKRPRGTYFYNKLTANEPIFEPVLRPGKVRVIHLSHDGDARDITARRGVELRNNLDKVRTQLRVATQALMEAARLMSDDSQTTP